MPLLHAVDAPTLDALYADSRVAPLLGRRVAPTAALVAPEHLAALRQRLLDGDRPPALSEGSVRPAQPAFVVDGDGRICFRQRLPDIKVLQAVQQAADQEPCGSTRVTMHRLRRAAAQGLSVEDILGSLGGSTTARCRMRSCNWCVAGPSTGAAAHWPLSRCCKVESGEVLADLLADPEVRPYVCRLEGAATVAVVQSDGVECVRSVLQTRGMEFADHLF